MTPSRIYVIFAVLFGAIMTFLTPPFQVADEMTHFLRAFQIAEGGMIPEKKDHLVGGWLPVSLGKAYSKYATLPGNPHHKVSVDRAEFQKLLGEPLDAEKREFWSFPNTSSYPPLVYAPQAAAIFLGRVMDCSVLKLMYLGRLFNLAAWIALTYLAIRIVPIVQWGMVLLALTPMALFQGASLSADAMVNGIVFLWIALCLYASSPAVPRVDLSLGLYLGAALVSLVLAKQAYFPLALLILIIPRRKFGNNLEYSLKLAAYAATAMVAMGLWARWTAGNIVPMHATADPPGQSRYLAGHLSEFLSITLQTYQANWKPYFQSLIGNLGWLDTSLPWPHILLVSFSIVTVVWLESDNKLRLSWLTRSLIFFSMIAVVFVISAAIYITWTTPGSNRIEGLQGRYFIPITPLVLLLIYHHAEPRPAKRKAAMLLAFNCLIISLPWTLLSLFFRYY